MRQVAPLAAASQPIEDGAEHLPLAVAARATRAPVLGLRQEGRNQRPLRLTHFPRVNLTFLPLDDFVYYLSEWTNGRAIWIRRDVA